MQLMTTALVLDTVAVAEDSWLVELNIFTSSRLKARPNTIQNTLTFALGYRSPLRTELFVPTSLRVTSRLIERPSSSKLRLTFKFFRLTPS